MSSMKRVGWLLLSLLLVDLLPWGPRAMTVSSEIYA
jgi:hypothetical protein